MHLGSAAAFVTRSVEFLVFAPTALPFFPALFAAAIAASAFSIRDPALLAVSLAPLLSAIVAFSVLEGALDEVYWCLTLTGPAAIAMFAWVDALPNQARTAIAAAVLGAVTLSQAARADMAWTFHRVPGYGAIVTGSRTIVDASRPVRAIALTFAVPPDTDPLWVFSLLGGVLSDDVDSPRAVIDRDGSVRYD